MKKQFSTLAALLWAVALTPMAASGADGLFPLPDSLAGTFMLSNQLEGGQKQTRFTTEITRCGDHSCYQITKEAADRTVVSIIGMDGHPVTTHYEKPASRHVVDIRYGPEKTLFTRQKEGETTTREIDNTTLLEGEMLGIHLVGFPFDAPKRVAFSVIALEAGPFSGKTFDMSAQFNGVEPIDINGVTQPAYKLTLSATGLLSFMSPKFYYWYSKERPHRLLKQQAWCRLRGTFQDLERTPPSF